eukprot:scaffold7714_cov25-Tisochrysis_lutea.AAC.10
MSPSRWHPRAKFCVSDERLRPQLLLAKHLPPPHLLTPFSSAPIGSPFPRLAATHALLLDPPSGKKGMCKHNPHAHSNSQSLWHVSLAGGDGGSGGEEAACLHL